MKQDLNKTLILLRQALAFDYRIVPVKTSDAPIFLAIAFPLAPEVTGVKPRLPSGRGLSLLQAMVSAGAEALELRSSLSWNNAPRIDALPRREGRCMVEARDMGNGRTVLVPAQQVFLDHAAATGEPLLEDARSTGCATASNRQDAGQYALLECIERDALAFWWHGGVAAFGLSLDNIDLSAPRLFWWLQTRSRQTRLLGLTSDTGVPVVVAVSSDADGRTVAYGAAARFDVNLACLAAVTELIQTEGSLAAALAAGTSEAQLWQDYASMQVQPQFNPQEQGRPTSWKTHDMDALLKSLAALDLAALSVDLTLAGDPLPTLRVLVPGLCDMGGRIDVPRFRRHCAISDPEQKPVRHEPEPF